MKQKRTYNVLVSRPGGYLNWPGSIVTTNIRLRHVTAYLFRRYFGRCPDRHLITCWNWGMAKDRRGNQVEVTQENWLPVRDWLLPVRTGVCACGRPPIVGLTLCETCHREAA